MIPENKHRDTKPAFRVATPKIYNSFKHIYNDTGDSLTNQSKVLLKKKKKVENIKKYKMAQQSTYQPTGMSSKDKSIVIMTCQKCNTRYKTLKALAENAIKHGKIFTIHGNCNALRTALVDRGWVEKLPVTKMNLHKIKFGLICSKPEVIREMERLYLSHMVEKYSPKFIWFTGDDYTNTRGVSICDNVIVNKLNVDAVWTTKQGLCHSMKSNYWFYIEDVADVNSPRSYNCHDSGETEDFIKDYRISACTSLLKWILTMVVNDRPVFTKNGNVSMNVVLFALNCCKDFLLEKQNRDIDRSLGTPTAGQWNAFLKRYYRIISREDCFEVDTENHLPLYLACAKLILKEMKRYRPQLSCEGCHNIWIIKPAHCSRGRGIRMASKLAVISDMLLKTSGKYVVQKYIEEPLLIHETKFDIRQYYLVTKTYPLVIWMYKNCYLKFSSQKYNLKNYHESIHLTNNAVQKKYKNCLERHPDLPQDNMWSLEQYKQYLDNIGKERVWNDLIYSGMKKSIVGIMLSCQDSLLASKNRFELYGCDFILDKEYKPWLIEINSCPDLNSTTPVTGKICPAVLADIVKVVIDNARNHSAATGNFECIYRQPLTMPCYGLIDMTVKGSSLPTEYFYRKSMEGTEFDDPAIFKEIDIKEVLNKLKKYYETDIMAEPQQSNADCNSSTDSKKSTILTELASSWTDSDNDVQIESVNSSGILKHCASVNANIEEKISLGSPISSSSAGNDFNRPNAVDVWNGNETKNKNCHSITLMKHEMVKSDIKMKSEKGNISENEATLEGSDLGIQKAAYKIIEFINNKQKEYLN